MKRNITKEETIKLLKGGRLAVVDCTNGQCKDCVYLEADLQIRGSTPRCRFPLAMDLGSRRDRKRL
jgi:hypothetical protein